jgi:predicted GH43/DUF377 family glycosyl hydrolase
MKLKRYEGNPVISPNPENQWEKLVTTNPAAWYEKEEGKVYMLYRAAGDDQEHKIHLGLALSDNGFDFERVSDSPVLSPLSGAIDGGAIEDPRIVKFGEWYYVTYASRPFKNGQYWGGGNHDKYTVRKESDLPAPFNSNSISTCLAFTRDFREWIRAGIMTSPDVHDHDVIIFPEKIGGKFVVMHRPDFGDGEPLGIWLSLCNNPLRLDDSVLLAKTEYDWEGLKIGGNCPPVKTDAGWLVIYHGVGYDRFYRLGAMLLDLEDPRKITARTSEPIFEPEEWYELDGHHNYKGVVFPCGNVVIDGKLIVYYGGADKYVGAASCELSEIVNFLLGK